MLHGQPLSRDTTMMTTTLRGLALYLQTVNIILSEK